jgi:hypothetical protein
MRMNPTVRPDEYNGYTNYQTWATALWMDNEPASNEYLYELANNITPPVPLIEKADTLKEYVTDMLAADDCPSGLGHDLLTHSLGVINWREIVGSHMEDDALAVRHAMHDALLQNVTYSQVESTIEKFVEACKYNHVDGSWTRGSPHQLFFDTCEDQNWDRGDKDSISARALMIACINASIKGFQLAPSVIEDMFLEMDMPTR